MERPSNIRAAAADEARDIQYELTRFQKKVKDLSRTNNMGTRETPQTQNLASRETQDSSIFSKIAKRSLRNKEIVKLMYSAPNGITMDSATKL